MGIDKIGPINNYNGINKINKTSQAQKTNSLDSVNISQEAKSMADSSKIKEIIQNTPDVRMDKINEVREKMKDPDYLDKIIADGLADKIMESFKI